MMKNIMSDLEFEALNADIRGEGEWDVIEKMEMV